MSSEAAPYAKTTVNGHIRIDDLLSPLFAVLLDAELKWKVSLTLLR